jgi:hypothetical protein
MENFIIMNVHDVTQKNPLKIPKIFPIFFLVYEKHSMLKNFNFLNYYYYYEKLKIFYI